MRKFIRLSLILTATFSFSIAHAGDMNLKGTVSDIMKVLLVNPTVGLDGTSYDFHPAKEDVCSQIFGDELSNTNCTDQWANFKVNYTEFEDGSGKFKFYFGDLMPASLTVTKGGEFGLKLYNHDIAEKIKDVMANLHANQSLEGLSDDEKKQIEASNQNDDNILSLIPKVGVELISFVKGDKSHEIKIEILEALSLVKNFGDSENVNNLVIQLGAGSVLSAKIDQLNLKSLAKFDFSDLHLRVPDLISPLTTPKDMVDGEKQYTENVPASINIDATRLAATLNITNDIKTFQLSGFSIDDLTLKLAGELFATLSTHQTIGSFKLAQTETGMRFDFLNTFHISAVIDDSTLKTNWIPSGTYFFKNGAGSYGSVDTIGSINPSLLSHIPHPSFGVDGSGNPYRYEPTSKEDPTIIPVAYNPTTQVIALHLNGFEAGAPLMGNIHAALNNLSATIYGLNTTDELTSMAGSFNLGSGYFDIGGQHVVAFNQNNETSFEAGVSYADNKLSQAFYISNAANIGLTLEGDLYKGVLGQFMKPEAVDSMLTQFGANNLQSVSVDLQANTLLDMSQGFVSGGITVSNTVTKDSVETTTVLFPPPSGGGN